MRMTVYLQHEQNLVFAWSVKHYISIEPGWGKADIIYPYINFRQESLTVNPNNAKFDCSL